MAGEKSTEVVVSVADDHLARLADVAKRLRQHGLVVHEVLAESGMITGRAPARSLASLRKLKGVLAVEESGDVMLPPPEGDVQ